MLWLIAGLFLGFLILGLVVGYGCRRNPNSPVAKLARAASDLADQYNQQYVYGEGDNEEYEKDD